MVRDNERYIKIYRQMWCILEDEELSRDPSRKVDDKWDFRETVDTFDSWLL